MQMKAHAMLDQSILLNWTNLDLAQPFQSGRECTNFTWKMKYFHAGFISHCGCNQRFGEEWMVRRR
jgi:hypothetical protein